MKLSKKQAHYYLPICARSGNRNAALKIFEVIAWHLERNKTIPKPIREYFIDCYFKIDIEKPELNKTFHITGRGKGKKISMGSEFKKNMEIIKYVNLLMDEGMKDDKAFKKAGKEFYKDKKTVRDKYNKFAIPVYSAGERLTPNQVAYVTINVLETLDLYLKEKDGGN